MSMIGFGICALLLISTISALPTPSGDIRSAIIQNQQNLPIRCIVSWRPLQDGRLVDNDIIIVDSRLSRVVNERYFDIGFEVFGTIKSIQCGDLVVTAPFEGVGLTGRDPWQFRVESDKIVSVGPKSSPS